MIGKPLILILAALVTLQVLTGCSRGVHGGDPALSLSNSNGTIRVLPADEHDVSTAISNAFGGQTQYGFGRYHNMSLSLARQAFDGSEWYATNGFALSPSEPIANVPLHGGSAKTVPYIAYFNITTKPVNQSNTMVTIRTIFPKVVDGEETGIHGGWARHERDVPPVKAEEENVLNAISNALVALRTPGKPSP
jgi:hypothetical protein